MNPIDALVVTLGFDTSGLKSGEREATDSLDKVRAGANKTTEAFLAGGKQSSESLKALRVESGTTAKEMEARGGQAAEFFGQIGNKVIGLAAAYIGLGAAKNELIGVTNATADLGRTAAVTGASIEQLSTLGNLIERNGGNAAAASAQVQGFISTIQRFKLFGQAPLEFQIALGTIDATSEGFAGNVHGVLQRLASYADQHKDNPAQTATLAGMLGITDTALVSEVVKGRKQFDIDFEKSRQNAIADKGAADAARDLQDKFHGLGQAVDATARRFQTKAEPTEGHILDYATKIAGGDHWKGTLTGALTGGAIGLGIGSGLFSPVTGLIGAVVGGVAGYEGAKRLSANGSPQAATSSLPFGPTVNLTLPSSSTTQPPSSILADLISRGEGDYDAVNLGKKGSYKSKELPLESMTVAQVIEAQQEKKFNAAGRYQIIATQLPRIANALGLKGDEKFDKKLQDKLFDFIITKDQPAIGDYISGKSNDVHAALLALSKEWASVANPDTGRSSYAGIAGNRATISVDELLRALAAARAPSAGDVAGRSSNHNTSTVTIGTMTINAPTGNGDDIANSFAGSLSENILANQANVGLR